MNIFSYEGKEFNKKVDEIFNNINPKQLKKDLLECGLIVEKVSD